MEGKKIKKIIASNLREFRKQNKYTQKELANKLGVSHNAISSWENGTNSIDIDILVEICNLFNITLNDMYSNNSQNDINKPINKTKLIPLVGTVACGNPIYAEENIEEYITVSVDDKVDFALHAKGDSMNNCKIDDGDIVYVRQQPIVNNGEIALVLVDDSATIKRFYDYGDKIVLRPDSTNPHHKEQIYDKNNYNVLVQGKIIFIKTFVN